MIMNLMCASLAMGPMVLVASLAYPQAPSPNPVRTTPGCSAPVWGDEVTRFNAQVQAYVDLRGGLEQGLSPSALATKIRAARATARQGDIFTDAISVEVKKALVLQMNAHVWKVIMDDNPGEIASQVNGVYPDGKPLATTPPNILAVLPPLPADIEYRFVERHLILLDTRAMVIVDRIPYAIRFAEGDTPCTLLPAAGPGLAGHD